MGRIPDVAELQRPLTELKEQLRGKNGDRRFHEFKLWLKGVDSRPDFIVRVDRSIKPPVWLSEELSELIHPELELAGPPEYDLSELEHFLHDVQKHGAVGGQVILDHLETWGPPLKRCLNFQDGIAIQQKGRDLFRKLFRGRNVFLWGSVGVCRYTKWPIVPYLLEFGHMEPIFGWRYLKDEFFPEDIAPVFPRSA